MPTSTVVYLGELRCQSVHTASQTAIVTDAPTDNQGKGEAFSPTDLVATALANCMLTIMGIVAQRHQLDIKGSSATVQKIMSADAPRRIARVEVQLTMPAGGFSDKDKQLLEQAAHTCPVAKSLHPDIEQQVEFIWL